MGLDSEPATARRHRQAGLNRSVGAVGHVARRRTRVLAGDSASAPPRSDTFDLVAPAEHFVENFLQPLRAGEPQPPIRYDEARNLNVMPDGRALVDIEFEAGTVTGTRAGGEQDDVDRDREPTTVTLVHSEGVDYTAQASAVQAGTITVTEATAEATDSDEDISQLLQSPAVEWSPELTLGLLETITNTAVEAESSDID